MRVWGTHMSQMNLETGMFLIFFAGDDAESNHTKQMFGTFVPLVPAFTSIVKNAIKGGTAIPQFQRHNLHCFRRPQETVAEVQVKEPQGWDSGYTPEIEASMCQEPTKINLL